MNNNWTNNNNTNNQENNNNNNTCQNNSQGNYNNQNVNNNNQNNSNWNNNNQNNSNWNNNQNVNNNNFQNNGNLNNNQNVTNNNSQNNNNLNNNQNVNNNNQNNANLNNNQGTFNNNNNQNSTTAQKKQEDINVDVKFLPRILQKLANKEELMTFLNNKLFINMNTLNKLDYKEMQYLIIVIKNNFLNVYKIFLKSKSKKRDHLQFIHYIYKQLNMQYQFLNKWDIDDLKRFFTNIKLHGKNIGIQTSLISNLSKRFF